MANMQDFLALTVSSYHRGLLVPFMGAGMSRPKCASWPELVNNLERLADINATTGVDNSPADLTRRANRAVRVLRRDKSAFPGVVASALAGSGTAVPPQTIALSQIWWPLVLTTNYDDLYATAASASFSGPISVAGRSPADCRRILNSLHTPALPLIWALQGYIGTAPEPDATQALRHELVIGHDEYRRVTHSNPYFRTAFAEVFRTRSLLFLGSGLQDPYLLDLFGEVLEKAGPNPVPHFAIVRQGQADSDFLHSSLNIIAYEVTDHDGVLLFLNALRAAIDGERVRERSWSYATRSRAHVRLGETWDVCIERAVVPRPAEGECIAISCGYENGKVLNSGWMQEHADADTSLRGQRVDEYLSVPDDQYVVGGGPTPYYFVIARDRTRGGTSRDRRDLRVIGAAMQELLSRAADEGYRLVRAQLLAAGERRVFPPVFSIIEMLRAFGEWKRLNARELSLAIQVVDPSVIFALSTGRIDVAELLSGGPMRFWVEITGDANARHLNHERPETLLTSIARKFDVPMTAAWRFVVEPSPEPHSRYISLHEARNRTLREIGVVSSSTLRFAPM
jgi:hypothetical protein